MCADNKRINMGLDVQAICVSKSAIPYDYKCIDVDIEVHDTIRRDRKESEAEGIKNIKANTRGLGRGLKLNIVVKYQLIIGDRNFHPFR